MEPDGDSPTVIYRAPSPEQAHLLCNLLKENGIRARVDGETLQPVRGGLPLLLPIGLPFDASTLPRVVVAQKDAAEARRIIAEFEEAARMPSVEWRPGGGGDAIGVEEGDEDRPRFAWPACSRCGTHGEVECPACGERRLAFPLADYPWSGAPEADEVGHAPEDDARPPVVRLACPTCDHVFVPRPPGACAECGQALAGADDGESPFGQPTGAAADFIPVHAEEELDETFQHGPRRPRSAADDWRRFAILLLIVALLAIVALYLIGPLE